jgi:hypothetical protein
LLSEYVRYYHEDRTHLGLGQETPDDRIRSVASGRILSRERLTPIVADNKETVENAEGDRWNREEIHRSNRFPMVVQKRNPALGWFGVGFSPTIRKIRSRISWEILFLPNTQRAREIARQYKAKPSSVPSHD